MNDNSQLNHDILCGFKDTLGNPCDEKVYKEGLCYWHYDVENKSDEELKDKLEARARTNEPMRYYKLRNTDLQNIDLVNHGEKSGFELSHADLFRANMKNAHLFALDLSFSSLVKADLRGANLHLANLEHANLLGVKLKEAKLEGVQWGEVVRQEWQADNEVELVRKNQLYSEAEEIYRDIGRVMRNQGMISEVGWFYYREMVTRRKQMPAPSFGRTLSAFFDLFCGYGEKPARIISFSIVGILGFAIFYAFSGLSYSGSIYSLSMTSTLVENVLVFLNALYFSVVTFTTLGYGDITPFGLSRVAAALEAFSGSFTIALFVVVFVKKMSK